MKLYDTQSESMMEVTASESGTVDIYCCGPTVYRFAHVGNMRTFLMGDLVRRTLRAEGRRYRYIQNITDVGHLNDDTNLVLDGEADKILTQARLERKDPFEIARFYESAFHADLKALNILPADAYPKASESIALITDLVAQLIELGVAYQGNDGSVYFSARSCQDYGVISNNSLDNLREGYRFDISESEPGKRFHADWALWKSAAANREMTWPTPWGVGFPGWHIECSAMSIHYFPHGITLHLGGIDLRFPHHENERAQSNAVTRPKNQPGNQPGNQPEFVRQWVHGEHLLFEGRKMAKSAGNVLRVADFIEAGIDPLALRLVFLENHYRTQMNLTWDSVRAGDTTLKRWRRKLRTWPAGGEVDTQLVNQVKDFFSDDLNTSAAVLLLRKMERDDSISDATKRATFLACDELLGIDLDRVDEVHLTHEVQSLINQRAEARAAKDWQRSDEIRGQLRDLGYAIHDGPDGQSWELL